MSEDRISKLSQRFRTHAVGRRPSAERNRERHSMYLDTELVKQLDKAHRDINYELYPADVKKAEFLETVIQFGLENLDQIKEALSQAQEDSE